MPKSSFFKLLSSIIIIMEIINLKNAIEMDFEKIINNKSKCDEYINQIEEIIEKINLKYNSLMNNIQENQNIEIPIYLGIDSLQFQNKLYLLKLNNIKNIYNRTFNRIYADYYKIHKLIRKYITTTTSIPGIDINIPPYKDLDQNKYYKFEYTIKIQNTINQYIQSLYDIITQKNITIQPFLNSDKAGYAVNYYISEEKTNIQIYKNKCLLFINYLTTFNNYHDKYLSDFLLQCRFMITTVKNDIDFNIDNELIDVNEFINITHNEDISFNTHNEDISFNIHNEDISFNIHNENYLNEFESYLSDKENLQLVIKVINNENDENINNEVINDENINNEVINNEVINNENNEVINDKSNICAII